VAFNGAEPVRAETLDRFAAAFAPCGFRREAFYPCYGLAEATLFVAGGAAGRGAVVETFQATALERGAVARSDAGDAGRRLVSCGTAWLDQEITIADPETGRRCPPGRIGEIWVAGPSVAEGYWERLEATTHHFGARLAGEAGGPYLRTGDLGFLAGAELYVTGRLKDLIILRGRNHYPQDIEATAEESHPALRPGCGAAFAVDEGGEERLVVVQEIDRRREDEAAAALEAVRRAVAEVHEVQVHEVVLVRAGSVPKTSSGKIQRSACRAAWQAGELAVVARSAVDPQEAEDAAPAAGLDRAGLLARPAEERGPLLLSWLRNEAARALGVSPTQVEPERPLTTLGIDSLAAVELKARIEEFLEVPVGLTALLEGAALSGLAAEILARFDAGLGDLSLAGGPESGDFPLSAGQKSLWFIHRLAPESLAYSLAGAARVQGDLDPEALVRAVLALAERHPALRTTFGQGLEGPFQRVHARLAPEIRLEDATALSAAEVAARVRELAWRPFDLERGPLFRVSILRAGPGEDVLVFAVHHIVCDFWSAEVMARDLGALLAREGEALPPLPLRYTDCARWWEERLAGPTGERLWRYWSERLDDGPSPLDLVPDRPRPPVQTWNGGARNARVDAGTLERLRSLARERGATLYAVLVAAFQALLGRYSRQDDFLIGSPTSGRPVEVMAGLVGYFVNPVVLRADLSGDPGFGDLVERTRATVLGALEHQDFPFPTLAERLVPDRDPSRSPLFDVLFAFEKERGVGSSGLAGFALGEGGVSLGLASLEMETLALEPPGAAFDLSLMAAELEGRLGLSLRYNAGLFDSATAERMLDHLRTLLAGAAESPAARLSELPLLEAAEREQLLVEFNRTGLEHPRTPLLHELFLAQAERTPDAVALVHGEQRLTYRELAERSLRLAGRLRATGVGLEVPVGVCLQRTPLLVATLLGTLRSGGFYVPLDPNYPAERLKVILEDCRAPVLVTEERCLEVLPATGARLLRADRDEEISPELAPPAADLSGEVRALHLAYTIYTSGSTGRPKGVAITHRNAVALAFWSREVFRQEELAGVLGSTSICFDMSVFELFVTLAWGGTVILAENALELRELPARDEVTLINTVPSAMSELLRLGAVPPSVRTVNLGGEPLRGSLARRIHELGPVRLYNVYGPSEDTTFSTCADVGPQGEPIIGRPLANTRVYILDRDFRLMPVGVAGELYLSGEGISRGYLGRPDMTAERYLPDLFGATGVRMYRTGDLARWRSDGELEYLGRLDHQVKVRGFRVELGEIEAALLAHPEVRDAAVILREAAPGDSRLTAFVAPGAASPAALRLLVARRLPDYMVPSAVVALDILPLLPNGKVDRRALARLPATPAHQLEGAGAAAPRTPVEELLAVLWCELLGAERVGIHDNFFALGGHSLLATQLASRVRDAFGVELPLQRIFEAPTVAELAAALPVLDGAPAPPVRPAPRDGDLPLSFAQERLWFLDRFEPGNALYNMPAAVRLRGELDPAALTAAFGEIVRRHEVLRSGFAEAGRRPVQRVFPWRSWSLPVTDLSALPEGTREAEALRLAGEEAARPFDLARPPLLRTALLRLGTGEHLLLVTLHHIVADGWSIGVLLRELAALYAAARAGTPPLLPKLAVQYADFAVWQREWLCGEALEAQLGYWRRALAGVPEILDLPLDRLRPAVQNHRGAHQPFGVPAALAAALRSLARREGLTPFMLLLAAFQALLSRISRQEDVVVGSPIANRNRLETENLIGFFVNTLALRLDLSGDPTSLELGRRAREATLGAYAHQDLPFEKLVEDLAPARDTSRTPVFQVLFALQNTALDVPSPAGLELEVLPVESGVSKFDLSLSLAEGAGDLTGFLEYATDLFEAATVERLGGYLLMLLEGITAGPERRLSELPLLTGAELEQILRLEGGGAEPVRSGELAYERFAARAQASPDAVALEVAGERLTCGELDRRSDRLARRLALLGVGREGVVGICLERSADLVASLLAVWKAGGAWVPLDPSHPAERLAWVLADSGARTLISERRLADRLGAGDIRTVLLDEEDWEGLERVPQPSASPGDLAYLIYTSGSTGRPKGVEVEHGSLAAFLRSSARRFGIGEAERWPVVAPFSFDIFLFELLAPLVSGGTAVLVPLSPALDVPALVRVLAGASRFHAVPALMRNVVEESRNGDPEWFAGLKTLFTGGDAVPADLLRDLRAVFPRADLAVLYGPTEATCFCTVYPLLAGQEAVRSLLGGPLEGARVELRDPSGNRVPLGVPGEIWIGGAGVARGYKGLEELTAERFPVVEGLRYYRSGDLARRLADRNLEFLERIDQQVKIRGFRIEPGEIEAVLARHPEVRQAAVVAREDGGERRLVAYVAAAEREGLTAELRERVQTRLPEYMVPSTFVVIERLPLTIHGKLDRRALPAPEWERAEYVAPRTPTEDLLAGIWSEVLGVERVGATDDFFALGGHSLLATQLASRVRATFGVELPLRKLFEEPTVAGLARRLQDLGKEGPEAPPIRPVLRDGSLLPLSFAQERLWFLDRVEPGTPLYNIPVAARLSGDLDLTALAAAVGEIVRRHEALRTGFAELDGSPMQRVSAWNPWELPVTDLLALPAEVREREIARLGEQEAARPFDLSARPGCWMVRTILLRISPREHVLLITFHHIAADGWSIGVFVRELALLYKAFASGRPSPLPELPIQYTDFAVWQREWLRGEILEKELAYWRRALAGAPEVLDLPLDRPRSAVRSFRGARHRFILQSSVAERLAVISRKEEATSFMLLLAGFQALLSHWSRQKDMVVGSPIANRNRLEVEPLIGFFANTLALRLDLSGNPPFRELVRRLREVTLEAYVHQDLPFEKLVEELAPARDTSHTPVFQVFFALQNAPAPARRLPGLEVELLEVDERIAKFDLTLALVPTEGGGLAGSLEYATDLFEPATVQRLSGHLLTLLEGIAAGPERRLSELPLLTAAEREQLLGMEGSEAEPVGAAELAHERFAARVQASPDAGALEASGERLTYGELDRRADRLARRLASLGVGQEVVVGICLQRSADLVAAMLGVWKAGGAWVPLDPSHPAERLAYILANSGARALISERHLAERLGTGDIRTVLLDEEGWKGLDGISLSSSSPENLAYLIYTSGSTGRPKGVKVEHGSLAALLRSAGRQFGFSVGERWPVVAPSSFDIFLFELLAPLVSGGTAVLVPLSPALDVPALVDVLEGAARMHAVPALMRRVVEEARGRTPERFVGLKTLFSGGDAVPLDLLTALRETFPSTDLVVLYGPTEATVFCTAYVIPGGERPERSLLGDAFEEARVELRDAHGQRVPLGVPGEIWIGGFGVARGYAGLEELTAERFPVVKGRRYYRSGDLARRLPDGNLEFLGRVDQQVKIRGFRIEPGEIETALAEHPEVRQAVVLAREDVPGDRRLVAYVVAPRREGLVAELRQLLQARLPEYMIPSMFVPLESLPLTVHGKLDRQVLAVPAWESAEVYVAPRTPDEELLAGIWADVLGIEHVGLRDDFFALGGHSLLATRVASRVRTVFGVSLPLRRFFEGLTVERLAAEIAAARAMDRGGEIPPLDPVPRSGAPLPLSFAQQRLWFLDQFDPGNPTYNMPVAVRMSGPLDRSALERALAGVVERHEALRTRFPAIGGEPVQVVEPELPLALDAVEVQGTPAERETAMLRLACEEALRPFDLERGPLVRTRLLRLDDLDLDHVLLLTVHHIVSDGWSLGILVREVAALYEGCATGKPAVLPALPVQYADFAVWQRSWLSGEVLEREVAWWRERLAGAPASLELPTDRPRPAVKTSRGALRQAELSGDLSAVLRALSRRSGSTLFMTLLAGLATLLHRYTGQDDVLVGSPVANRNRTEVEPLIGFFVNTLVMRADLAGDPAFFRFLERMRETALEAYAHQDLPFEKVVEAVRPDRDLARSPLFQIAFALQNLPESELRLASLTLSPVPMGSETVKFDWDIAMEEEDGAIRLRWVYNVALFDSATIERAIGHLETLLAGAATDPGQGISDLPLLRAAERSSLLTEWTAPIDYPADGLIHERVAAQAARSPGAVAFVLAGETLTYGQLDARANRMAHRLRRLGVGPEEVVGICLDRSFDLVVGMLAVLKAGGAYLPLDPDYPRERLEFMLWDSEVRVLLAQRALIEDLRGGLADLRALAVDAEREAIERESDRPPEVSVDLDHPAYVIYTSGSTGVPKGVVVSHRALANRLGYAAAFDLWADDVFLQKTSASFDVSVLEIFGPLVMGGRSVLVPAGWQKDVEALLRLIAEQGVTQASFPPSLLYVLLERDDFTAACRSLRTVITGGEVVPADLPGRLFDRLDADLLNRYGPTEATISVTSWTCRRDVEERALPIGRPIANAGVYVLDCWMNPVPAGVPGELYLGGVCLARGYLRRPELTAERFMPNPFASARGERLYRTGDLARFRPDGALEFGGRVDGQVKIRGFRVELGEVEAALAGHPAVREVVVTDREQRVAVKAAAARALVAYVVLEPGQSVLPAELREFAHAKLPPHMVPSAFVILERLPLGPTGKVDRRALPAPEEASRELEAAAPRTDLERRIAAIWREVLGVERVGLHDNFFDLGGHSLLMARVHDRLRKGVSRSLSMVELFQFPTVADLAGHLGRRDGMAPGAAAGRAALRARAAAGSSRVAIVGMAGRFPRAADVAEFWRNLRAGVEAISFFSNEELRAEGIDPALLAHPRYVKAGGALEGGDLFDAGFFGYSHREAELMDPQHRVFLECAWEAMENAGYDPAACPGTVGVYAGASFSSYLRNLAARGDLASAAGSPLMGNDKDFVATRVSYKLNLRGPSFTVQTACSTSLVAAHLACQALLGGECDMALAGAVSIGAPLKSGYVYEEGSIHSPDGHCRAFDAAAGGAVRGNGAGVVVLKRLEDALADGDRIHAVILGSALNNDGAAKVGYTAPSVEGQAAVIAEAQAVAGVSSETIGYVEAHGTGTRLGDPIEVAALRQVFGTRLESGHAFCALGSVKTNIGHLDAAAGVAGLIKAALAVETGLIPPSLNFERANPELALEESPFFVNNQLREWPIPGSPHRAGVSSFGIGGTNAHVVIEEPPAAGASGPSRPVQLLLLSARSEEALEAATRNLADRLERHPETDLADAAYTLRVGRHTFAHRRVVVCRGAADALAALREPRRWLTRQAAEGNPSVAFLFPGQGAQYVNMGRDLYEHEAVFREHVDLCVRLLAPHLGLDLRAVLHPDAAEEDAAAERLNQTALAQPALFAVESALAKLWMSWGIRPSGMLGHSLGEYVAAWLAGVFSLEDALAIVAARGALMQRLPSGAMLAVPLPEAEVEAMLDPELSLAAVNAPSLCVVSGPEPAVAALRERLEASGVRDRRLVTSHAFHSAMMEPVLAPFAERLGRVHLNPPSLPWISNLTGDWIRPGEATDPVYWVRHLRATVRFAAGLEVLLADPGTVLLETGPGDGLTNLARRQPGAGLDRPMIAAMRHPRSGQDDLEVLLGALGRLWLAGARPDWAGFHASERRRRVELPTYPFERQRYWVMPGSVVPVARPSLEKRPDPGDWTYVPGWKRVPPPAMTTEAEELSDGLLFLDRCGVGAELASGLAAEGRRVATVLAADRFARLGNGAYTVDPSCPADYVSLLADLQARGWAPRLIVHLWSVTAEPISPARAQETGFYSLLFLAQAIGRWEGHGPLDLLVVSNQAHEVTGGEEACPDKALLLGPCWAIPREYPDVSCRWIDIDGEAAEALTSRLLGELSAAGADALVAYRCGHRWVRTWEPVRLDRRGRPAVRLREGGVYLVTGGLGGIGLALAGFLAREARAKLILTGRSGLLGDDGDRTRRLQELEREGVEVLVVQADVCSRAEMAEAVRLGRERFGPIRGAIHAAGVPGGGMMQIRSREAAAAVLAPKVEGTRILAEALAGEPLDFLVLCSSLATLAGGFGNVDYVAANAFLDAFAERRRPSGGPAVLSIAWDAWQQVGMAARAVGREAFAAWGGRLQENGILPEEGWEVMRCVLAGGLPRVVVSTRDLESLLSRADSPDLPRAVQTPPPRAVSAHPRPNLATAFVEPCSDLERRIAGLWRDLLGVEPVGLHDSFFELGGHSLLATQLMSQVRDLFGAEVSFASFFDDPSVAGLAARIEGQRAKPSEEELAQMMAEIKQLSAEDLQALLAVERQSLLEGEPQ
jgi:amino acid adenylation domain-containing protein